MMFKTTNKCPQMAKYGETLVALMVVGPYKLYVYWEINIKDILSLKNLLGKNTSISKYILRVYDISGITFNGNNAHYHFDIQIDKDTENWYIDLWSPGNSYCVELGIKANNRNFFPLVRSDSVITPRVKPSNLSKLKWMKVKIEQNKTSFQLEENIKLDDDSNRPASNDNSSFTFCNDIETRLINYGSKTDKTDILMQIAKSWNQIKDSLSTSEMNHFLKDINYALNNPEHDTAIARQYEILQTRQVLSYSSINLMSK